TPLRNNDWPPSVGSPLADALEGSNTERSRASCLRRGRLRRDVPTGGPTGAVTARPILASTTARLVTDRLARGATARTHVSERARSAQAERDWQSASAPAEVSLQRDHGRL